MVPHLKGNLSPSLSRILEIADGFFLLTVDADDRVTSVDKHLAHLFDVSKLFFTFGRRCCGPFLVIDTKSKVYRLE
jgi:hypothetical protein